MIDLHMHSRYSEDGGFTPSELVGECAKKGIRMMSVTDHNCAKANKEAAEAAVKMGLLFPVETVLCKDGIPSNGRDD